ncbi:MAG: hypothetical protein ACKO2A_02035, partial [Acidimicrobiaceae bacterium]
VDRSSFHSITFWLIIKPRRYQYDLSEYKRAFRTSVEYPDYLSIGNRLSASHGLDSAVFDLAGYSLGWHAYGISEYSH